MMNLVPIRFYLQAEGLVVLSLATAIYGLHHFSWWLYGLLFLVPDLSMLGYLANNRVGALGYNLGHSYILPALLLATGWATHSVSCLMIALIWCAHIGFDRMISYGLKYDSSFKETHLQKL